MYALVDCNSFYVSCERLFRPDLKKRPVIVLSNNDGCVVARSTEAKRLGISMAVPFFKVQPLCHKHDVAVFSSNYTLYQDISNRVMCTLESLAPVVNVYSIDEAFLQLHGLEKAQRTPVKYAAQVRSHVYRHVGVPVGIGLAPTKTLAKLAARYAKQEQGVCVLNTADTVAYYLKQTPVLAVWGVGKAMALRLERLGITTAWQLAQANKHWLRKHGSVVLERTARELQSEPCINLADANGDSKQVICSRSFGQKVTDKLVMREALCHHVARASAKLREKSIKTKHLSVFFRTSLYSSDESSQYRVNVSTSLTYPTQDTRVLTRAATVLLDKHWREGFRYAKAGVVLSDLSKQHGLQYDLLESYDEADSDQSARLFDTIDAINLRFGNRSMVFAGEGVYTDEVPALWTMNRNHTSPRYTTSLSELPTAY